MARSIGEAAATGLESGFRLAMDYGEKQKRDERQARMDARAERAADESRDRQRNQDTLTALDAQGKQLQAEGQGLVARATPPDEQTQRDFAGRVKGLNQAKSQALSRVSGYDMDGQRKAGEDAIKKLQAGQVDDMQPGELSRAVTVATGRNPNDFIRGEGRPAAVEKSAMDFLEGMQTGDLGGKTLSGLNGVFHQELRKGVGSKSPHGTIVAKQIVQLAPDPNSTPDDPRVIPVMRVFVNSGKDFKGPIPEGMPEGSTGYYDAPLTHGRTSDPADPAYEKDTVRSIGIQEGMDYIGKQLELVEALNHPESLQRLKADSQAPGWNPDDYLAALTQAGAAPKKKPGLSMDKPMTVAANSSLIIPVRDAQGNVTGTQRIEGNEKKAPARVGTTQEKVDAIDRLQEQGTLSEQEAADAKKALVKTVTTKPAGRSGSGSGSGSNVQSTKVGADGFMIAVFRDGTTKRLLLDGKPVKAQDYAKRVDKLSADIGKSVDGIGKPASELRAEAEATLAEHGAQGSKVMKFDKQGNLVK